MTSQNVHVHRLLMTIASLGIPEHRIHVRAPAVGGGFGSKIHHYPDEAVTAWASMRIGRPVKWNSTRSEASITDAHGRDHRSRASLGIDDDGRITLSDALRLILRLFAGGPEPAAPFPDAGIDETDDELDCLE